MTRAIRTLLLVAGAVIIIALSQRFAPEETPAGTEKAEESGEKKRIRDFWRLNGAANQERLSGRYEEAARLYRESLELNPRHEDSLYYLGASLEEAGEYGEAASAYRRLAEINPSSSRAFAQLGGVLSLRAPGADVDLEGASEAYRRAASLNPEHSGSSLHLGLLDLDNGKLQAAHEQFQTAAGFGSPAGTFWLGYTLYLQGKKAGAMAQFRKVLDDYEHEREIAARGAALEGDILPSGDQPLNPQQWAVLASMTYLERATGQGQHPKSKGSQATLAAHAETWESRLMHKAFPHGGRAGWADFDNDGRHDVAVAGIGRPLLLYRNTPGGFLNVTSAAGLQSVSAVWDVVWVDIDRDGFQDLYLIRPGFSGVGENQLFRNNGRAVFVDVTRQSGLGGRSSTAKAVFVDLDQDGNPDLVEVGSRSGESSGVRIYRNHGGSFREVAHSWGVTLEGTVVDCVPIDFDSDGLTDLFFLRWKRPAMLYRNQGGGKFVDATSEANLEEVGQSSLSAVAIDFNRDTRTDLLVTAYADSGDVMRQHRDPSFRRSNASPRLYRNNSGKKFADVSEEVGLVEIYGTIQAASADVDRDGWPDVVLANGSLDGQRLETSVVLRNDGGNRFHAAASLPAPDAGANYIGVSSTPTVDGPPLVYFARNPLFPQGAFPGGLFELFPLAGKN